MLHSESSPLSSRPLPLRWIPAVVAAVLLVVSFALFFFTRHMEFTSEKARFDHLSSNILRLVQGRLDTYTAMLRSTRGYLSALPVQESGAFYRYAGQLQLREKYPGAQGIGFARRLLADELAAATSEIAKQNGFRNFKVYPDYPRPEYYPILSLYPQDRRNQVAIGFDMFSEPIRHEAMARARDSGEAFASGKVTLVQEIDADKQAGFLIYLPLYRTGADLTSVEGRREAIRGFVYAPFRADDFLQGVLGDGFDTRVGFKLYDGTEMSPDTLLHDSDPFLPPLPHGYHPSIVSVRTIEAAGRPWTFEFYSRPAFAKESQHELPLIVLLSGMTITLLGAGFAVHRLRAQKRLFSEQRSLYAQKERLRVTMSSIADGVVAADRDRRISVINPVAEQLLGISAADAQGKLLSEVVAIHESDISPPQELPLEGILEGSTLEAAVSGILVSNQLRRTRVEVTISPIRSSEGRVDGVVLVMRDVTEKFRRALMAELEHEVIRSLAYASSLAEAGPAVLKPVCVRLGWDVGLLWLNVPHDQRLEFAAAWEAIEGESRLVEMSKLQTFGPGEGLPGWLLNSSTPHWVEDISANESMRRRVAAVTDGFRSAVALPLLFNGRVLGVLEFYSRKRRTQDPDLVDSLHVLGLHLGQLVERKRWEAALVESESRFRLMADFAPVLIWVCGPDKRCTWFNKNWLDFTGKNMDQEVGDGWVAGVHPDDVSRCMEVFGKSLDARNEFKVEYRLLRNDGVYRWVLSHGIPRYAQNNEFTGFIGSCIDITERRTSEEERAKLFARERLLRSEAEMANRMKDEFLATLSHELRTPLNAILGWVQLVRRKNVDPQALSQGMDIIERNARSQAKIIEDLLDMNRIISGKIRLDVHDLDVREIVADAIETTRPAARAKEIELVTSFPRTLRHIRGDRQRLGQVLWNLLSNAVKFTPKGGRIDVTVAELDTHVQISIRDSGEGIAEAFLPHVFDRFRQGDASTTRRHGGLGLGLAIAKNLVELHRGTITATSAGQGAGAEFSFTVPLVSARDAEHRPDGGAPEAVRNRPITNQHINLRGSRVLVVDDQEDARELVRAVLEEAGAKVLTADSAQHGIATFMQHHPDVLISDIGMPEMDGYQFISELRRLPNADAESLPAIALTAFARVEDRAAALKAGYQVHLAKPIEPDELLRAVHEVVAPAGGNEPVPARLE